MLTQMYELRHMLRMLTANMLRAVSEAADHSAGNNVCNARIICRCIIRHRWC